MKNASLRTACLVGTLLAGAERLAPAQVVTRVDLDSAGSQALHGTSSTPALSNEGRFVAFVSFADNLVTGASGGHVYVRDTQSGITEADDVDSSGAIGNAAPFDDILSISADGRFVAFASTASNLVANDTNGMADVFVHDRATGATERISVDSSGAEGNNDSWAPSISADGSKVAFLSRASNLVTITRNGVAQVYVHDRTTGVTEIESIDQSGNPAVWDLISCALSGDGNSVAFVTMATLLSSDTNNSFDAMVRDRATGTTTLVSLDSNGVQKGCSYNSVVSLSGDGRFVALESLSQLDVNVGVSVENVFVRDRKSLTTECVSVSNSGVAADFDCGRFALSADGRYVAFATWARDLASDPNAIYANVFRRDRTRKVTEWCSANTSGKGADGDSGITDDNGDGQIALSPDGDRVAYWSYANDLVAGDTNGFGDVFVWGQPLALIADPTSAPAGATMTFSSYVGEAGGPMMLVATNADGIPMFTQVYIGLFDANGLMTLSGVVPFGLQGHVVTLQVFGVLPTGKSGVSNPEVVTFQ